MCGGGRRRRPRESTDASNHRVVPSTVPAGRSPVWPSGLRRPLAGCVYLLLTSSPFERHIAGEVGLLARQKERGGGSKTISDRCLLLQKRVNFTSRFLLETAPVSVNFGFCNWKAVEPQSVYNAIIAFIAIDFLLVMRNCLIVKCIYM